MWLANTDKIIKDQYCSELHNSDWEHLSELQRLSERLTMTLVAQEHPMPAKHHPLEPDHHLHPEECHVVSASAHRPQYPREQWGKANKNIFALLLPSIINSTFFFLFFQPWCRLITTIYNYFVVTNFFWMFVEGCYLHTAIVMTYSTDKLRKWVFLFIGWCEYVGVDSALVTLRSARRRAPYAGYVTRVQSGSRAF